MKTKLIAAAVGSLFALAAQAGPIALPGGPIYFQFNNLEQVCITNCIDNKSGGTEGNWGVFNISSMQLGAVAIPHNDISGGPTFFSDDGPGNLAGQISGIFYGLQVTSATTQAGGFLELYWTNAGADTITAADLAGGFSPTNRTAANQAGKFTSGSLLAKLQFMPGVVSGDGVTTTQTNAPILDILNGNSNFPGAANSFADVVDVNGDGVIDALDGAWAAALNGNWFDVDVNGNGIKGEAGEKRDLRFSNLFNALPAWDSGTCGLATAETSICGLRSNDPGRVFAVPEPASLALLGLGLVGLGFSRRRKVS